MNKISSISKIVNQLFEENQPYDGREYIIYGETFNLNANNIMHYFIEYKINRPLITI